MTNRSVAIIVALALAACRGQDRAQRSKPNYEVVQEGSASGVTSTINGPGETPAPATDTNVDTTTNFTLLTNPNPLGNDTAGSTVAGSLPSNPIYSAETPATRRTRATDTRGMASSSAPVATDTVGSTTPPMPKETRTAPLPSETDTSTTMSSSDVPTTTTSSDAKKKRDDKSGDQQPPPPPTDTTSTQG